MSLRFKVPSRWKASARRLAEFLLPPGGLSAADWFLLRWICLSVLVLGGVVVLMAGGWLEALDREQLRLLGGHPFYIEAEAAQVSLVEPTGLFALCVVLVLLLGLALLRQERAVARAQIAFLAAVAVGLPGLMCVLWGGVLYVSAPLVCVLALWVLVMSVPFFRRQSL